MTLREALEAAAKAKELGITRKEAERRMRVSFASWNRASSTLDRTRNRTRPRATPPVEPN